MSELTGPDLARRSWGFSPWMPAVGALLAAGGLVGALLASAGRDEVVAVAAVVLGLLALLIGWRLRPRLLADPAGVTVRTLLGARRVPWSDVESVTTVTHRRLGTGSSMLEINLHDDSLLVFSDTELGARGDDVAAVLRSLHAAASADWLRWRMSSVAAMSEFPLTLNAAVEQAANLVNSTFPDARAAWLGGSVAAGTATASSDLDITILLAGPPAPFRESLYNNRIPVELFVHTDESLACYRGKDRTRRQATLAALVAESVVLLDRDGSGRQLRDECAAEIAAGPDPLSDNDIATQRYLITGLLDDLTGTTDPDATALLAGYLWDNATRLLLGIERRWQGSGKGLLRALRERNQGAPDGADELGSRLGTSLRTAAAGPAILVSIVDEVLNRCGGRLFGGYRVDG